MALTPIDEIHAVQIQAGTLGRKRGHEFEDSITKRINEFPYPVSFRTPTTEHVVRGDPAELLLKYVAASIGLRKIRQASAISTGALATSEEGKSWLSVNGANISRCKSDLILTLRGRKKASVTIGISTKQCNNKQPTNAQLYFTTARGFANLLQGNGVAVSKTAIRALRQFCGDPGFRPSDDPTCMQDRDTDPRRFFWEEIIAKGRREWEACFAKHQDLITRLLLQKAYLDDPFTPDYVLHKTKHAASWNSTEVAIYSIAELVALSRAYQGFATSEYSIRKGSYKDPPGITHLAPRFGVVQMQRGGQKQHPEQLQFNLMSGYFYKI